MGQKVNPWIIRHTAGYQEPNAVWINTKNPGDTLNEDINVRKSFTKLMVGIYHKMVDPAEETSAAKSADNSVTLEANPSSAKKKSCC